MDKWWWFWPFKVFCSYYSDDDAYILHDDELCAGLPHTSRQGKNSQNNYVTSPGRDACQGDSGGPLLCSIDDKAVLVGVVSHGSGCGEEGKPGIYAKVDYFNEWLETGKSGSYLLIDLIIIIRLFFMIISFSSCRTFFSCCHKSSSILLSHGI